MKIFSDKPISYKKEDILNRSNFADMVADYLLSNITKDGFVVSINGPWGCGKTSIINMVKEYLRNHVVKDNPTMPVFVDFSPWNATSQDQIIKQFLNILSDSFKQTRVLKAIEKSLKIMSTIVDFAPLPPLVRSAVKSIEGAFNNYKKAIEKNKNELDTYKNAVVEHLGSSYVRYIIFIDDIDRLNDEEIKLIIQLIKSVCDFPNVTYVLCYDKDIIAGALNNAQTNVDGYKYLEKIVQMEFNVPRIKMSRMKEIAATDLLDVIGTISEKDIQNIRTYIGFGLFSQLTNIREEKRYINSLDFAIRCHRDEIDLADLCVITYLRNIDENAFKLILEYRDYILENGPSGDSDSIKPVADEFYKKLDETRYKREKSKYLLDHLFPNMFNTVRSLSPTRTDPKRLCNKKKFNRYLQLELDDNDIPAERLEAVLELKSVEMLIDLAHELTSEQTITFIISLENLTMDLTDTDKLKVVALFVFNYMSALHKVDGDYEFIKESVVRVICTHMIQNIGQSKTREILASVIPSASDYLSLISLYYLTTDGASYGGVLTNFDDAFKNELLNQAKNCLIKDLNESQIPIILDAYGINRFLFNECKNEIVEVLKTKDKAWLCKFLISTIYRGISRAKTTEYCYAYDEDLLSLIQSKIDIDFSNLRKFALSEKEMQRIIAIEMQAMRVPFKRGEAYYCNDIQQYCENNNIDFIPSDSYEESF